MSETEFSLDDLNLTEEEVAELSKRRELKKDTDYRFITSNARREGSVILIDMAGLEDPENAESASTRHKGRHRLELLNREMTATDKDFAIGRFRGFMWACGLTVTPDLPRKNPASGKYEVDGVTVTDYDKAKADNIKAIIAAMGVVAQDPSKLNGLAPVAQVQYNKQFMNFRKFKPASEADVIEKAVA